MAAILDTDASKVDDQGEENAENDAGEESPSEESSTEPKREEKNKDPKPSRDQILVWKSEGIAEALREQEVQMPRGFR